MTLYLYNTRTRKREVFTPLSSDHVGMYVCGPTVYGRAHLGNLRPVVLFDVLYRLLQRSYKVTYVRNITDIDDKIIKAAHDLDVSIPVLTEQTTGFFHDDTRALFALDPTIEPRATDHIPEMIDFIEQLISKEKAYVIQGHVLFHVSSCADYGAFSHRCREDMIAGARVEVAPYKKDPADFVLWKPSDETQPGWESPWGRGRPGWHIECSAMSAKHLGMTFDIHAGGQDLIFPHHENEIAQSTSLYGADTFARYWLHNGVLTVNGEKMSKSLGNFITLEDLLKNARGETIRFALLSSHYRQPLDWTDQTLPRARVALNRLYGALGESSPLDVLNEGKTPETAEDSMDPHLLMALEDDLNTPLALAHLHALASQIYTLSSDQDRAHRQALQRRLRTSAALLGLLQADNPQHWFQARDGHKKEEGTGSEPLFSPSEIEQFIRERDQARQRKDFEAADHIRDHLAAQGILLMDHVSGTTWRYM